MTNMKLEGVKLKGVKFGVVVFPGSNCDRDVAYVTRDLLKMPTRMVWHQETNIDDLDVVVLPGGFSYGDYLSKPSSIMPPKASTYWAFAMAFRF
jgi:phosphoribosylformylglycinamidine (FGAM) synthase-like amidotransferase family enzyme